MVKIGDIYVIPTAQLSAGLIQVSATAVPHSLIEGSFNFKFQLHIKVDKSPKPDQVYPGARCEVKEEYVDPRQIYICLIDSEG